MNHASVMSRCHEKLRQLGVASLTEIERIVALVSWANFEIELGGFSGYFYNSAGDRAAETVAALERIGAFHASAALRSALSRFPGGVAPTEQDLGEVGEWQQILGTLDEYDTEYYQETPDVFSKLCAFIDANAGDLLLHES